MVGARAYPLHIRRGMTAACALLAFSPGGGLAQPPTQPPSVSELVITPLPMVPVPDVGEGAPLYSVPEIQAVETEARFDVMEAASALRGCNKGPPTGPRPQFSSMEADAIGTAAARNGGHILLPPGNQFAGGPFGLEYAAAKLLRDRSADAKAASAAAERVRREAAQGRATSEAVEEAELIRQKAVSRMTVAMAISAEAQARRAEADYWSRQLKLEGPPPTDITRRYASGVAIPERSEYANLALEGVTARTGADRRGAFIAVSGQIRNTRGRPVNVPPLSVTAIDAGGFPLKTEIAQASGRPGRIGPGEAAAFAYQFRPSPKHADDVIVTFGSDKYVPWRLPFGIRCLDN